MTTQEVISVDAEPISQSIGNAPKPAIIDNSKTNKKSEVSDTTAAVASRRDNSYSSNNFCLCFTGDCCENLDCKLTTCYNCYNDCKHNSGCECHNCEKCDCDCGDCSDCDN